MLDGSRLLLQLLRLATPPCHTQNALPGRSHRLARRDKEAAFLLQAAAVLTPKSLFPFLLNVAPVLPVFIWGPPDIGKSALVRAFAEAIGLPCVSLLGSQLAPEDIIGVPQVMDGKSRFCPPTIIARNDPYCLFLDELNACSHEVQKAFYSLILDRRIGEFMLPVGTIVIGAGNRAEDAAITRPLSSARDWLEWAGNAGVNEMVVSYIMNRSDHLWSKPPKHEEPFSTPRSWEMLGRAIDAHGAGITLDDIKALASGLLTPGPCPAIRRFRQATRAPARPLGHPEGPARLAGQTGGARYPLFPGAAASRPADQGAPR